MHDILPDKGLIPTWQIPHPGTLSKNPTRFSCFTRFALLFHRQVADALAAEEGPDYAQHRYGLMPLIQSQSKPDRTLVKVKDIGTEKEQAKVWVRGRLHTSRSKGELG